MPMFTARTHTPLSGVQTQSCTELMLSFENGNVLAIEHVPHGQGYAYAQTTSAVHDVPEVGTFLESAHDTSFVVVPDGALVTHTTSAGTRDRDALTAAGELIASQHIAGASLLRVPDEGIVCVRYTGLQWTARTVERAPVPARAPIALKPHRWTLASAAVHGVMLASILFAPPASRGLCMDGLVRDDLRLVSAALLAVELERVPPPDFGDAGGREGQAHAGPEGTAGDVNSARTNNRMGIKKTADRPAIPREIDKGSAAEAGILGVLAKAAAGIDAPSSPYGSALPSGYDDANALGALLGAQLGGNAGAGGLGMRNAGRGGGGDGLGTIGLGKLGTIGAYGSGGDHAGYGSGVGTLAGRVAKVPRIRGGGEADVRGSLSKETIRRVIQRHLNEVRFCYEQGLAARADLAGRVQVQFVIAPSGAVSASSVQQSSLGAPDTATCISDAVRRWAFPAPDGGGVVIVSYPFLLESAG